MENEFIHQVARAHPSFLCPYQPIDKRRANLPHWEQGETSIFVTFHLADSIPHQKLVLWRAERDEWLDAHPKPWNDAEQREYGALFGARLDDWLDKGYGSQILGRDDCREIVWNALLHFDHVRYEMYAFVVMPTHVHALFKPLDGYRLEGIMHSWRSFTAKEINKAANLEGQLWQKEYWDRIVRSWEHFCHVVHYIERNPKKIRDPSLVVPVYVSSNM